MLCIGPTLSVREMPLSEERVREELERLMPGLSEVKEVADVLAVSRWQVYALLDQQAMTSVYIGRKRLVHAESLRAYVAALPTSSPLSAEG